MLGRRLANGIRANPGSAQLRLTTGLSALAMSKLLQRFQALSTSSTDSQEQSLNSHRTDLRDLFPPRAQSGSLGPKLRWTKEEDKALLDAIVSGKSYSQLNMADFQLRTPCAINFRMAKLRKEETAKGTGLVRKLPNNGPLRAWSPKEDAMLLHKVTKAQKRGQEPLDWIEIAHEGEQKDMIGRTAISCRRRWEIINPASKRELGPWRDAEVMKLQEALTKYLGTEYDIAVHDLQLLTVRNGLVLKITKDGKEIHPDSLTGLRWEGVAEHVGTRTDTQCRTRVCRSLGAVRKKGFWDSAETDRLEEAIKLYGKVWPMVAAHVGTRTQYQCATKFYRNESKAESA